MTSLETQLIHPHPRSNPNLPTGTRFLPLHPIALWALGGVPTVLVFPGHIDRDKLISSIERVSSVWPNIAGRYSRREMDGGGWAYSIDLTSSPIPLETQKLSLDTAFPDNDVVQPSLQPFLPILPSTYSIPDTDSHLVAFRLTHLNTSSVLGIAWAHIVGDGATASRFLRDLSSIYAGLPLTDPPSFFPHIHLPVYPPPPDVLERFHTAYLEARHKKELGEMYGAAKEAAEKVVLRLSRHEVAAIKAEYGGYSDQDAISAWWIMLINRTSSLPRIQRVIYTVNYRMVHPKHPSFPPNLPTLSSNVSHMRSISVPESTSDIAPAIRNELTSLRNDPTDTLEWLSVAAYRHEQTTIADKGYALVPSEDDVMVNSNLRYEWNVPFGFDDSNFHTSFSMVRFLRVFQANTRSTEGYRDAELCFNVANGTSGKLLELVQADRERWGYSADKTTPDK